MFKKAVVDRIEDGSKVVILIGDEEQEHIIDINKLPKGVSEGDILKIYFDIDKIIKYELDKKETDIVKNRIEEKMRNLKINSNSKFLKR